MPVTRHAEAVAVLADARYVPPPVRAGGAEGTLAWLRDRVSRFSTGPAHAERRRPLVALLDGVDPAGLREAARAMTRERGGSWRGVPVSVLGAALGVEDTGAVPAAAAGYLSGEESPRSDAAVAELLEQADIPVLTLLLQAHTATETLIENALRHTRATADGPIGDVLAGATANGLADVAPAWDGDVEALLHETLRHDPPLKATRRLDTRTGDEVTIDLVAVNRDPEVFPDPGRFDPARGRTPYLTFGSGVRPCPAPHHALALAAGVLEGLLP